MRCGSADYMTRVICSVSSLIRLLMLIALTTPKLHFVRFVRWVDA
jgi:hypothetical protein